MELNRALRRDQGRQDDSEDIRSKMLSNFELLLEKFRGVVEDMSALGARMTEYYRMLNVLAADVRKNFDKVWGSSAIVEERLDSVHDDLESVIYEEEVFDSISDDEVLLSNEDQDFVDSIRNPTSCCDYSSSSEPTLSDLDDSTVVSKDLIVTSKECFSWNQFSIANDLLMMNNYNFMLRFSVNMINLYIIFVWDPGIIYFYVHF